MEKPKFKLFGDKKYKDLYASLPSSFLDLIESHKIDSPFISDADFKDVDKWRNYLDSLENEHMALLKSGSTTGDLTSYLNKKVEEVNMLNQQQLEDDMALLRSRMDRHISSDSSDLYEKETYSTSSMDDIQSLGFDLIKNQAKSISKILEEENQAYNKVLSGEDAGDEYLAKYGKSGRSK